MEYILSCEICSLEYNETETLPIILDCGHSFCTSCIIQLENALCPKCRARIRNGKVFPVNFSLLNVVEEWKSEKPLNIDIVSSIQNLKRKLNSKLSVINKMFEICSKKESIESDLRLLSSMEEETLKEESGSKKEMEMPKKLRKLEEKYKECSLVNYIYFDDLHNFSLQNGQSSDTFFQVIYNTLKTLEKIFTYKRVNEKLKFGELTIRDNKIMIHSLSLNDIPKGSKIVQFKNVIEGLRAKSFHAFFEIPAKNKALYTVIIQLHDSKLVPHFIELCTAENGSTYKNCPISKGKNEVLKSVKYDGYNRRNVSVSEITLESILQVNPLEVLPHAYYKNNFCNLHCVANEIIVKETTNNRFQIFKVVQQNSYSILGKVVYPPNLWNYVTEDDEQKILDCGIVTEV